MAEDVFWDALLILNIECSFDWLIVVEHEFVHGMAITDNLVSTISDHRHTLRGILIRVLLAEIGLQERIHLTIVHLELGDLA